MLLARWFLLPAILSFSGATLFAQAERSLENRLAFLDAYEFPSLEGFRFERLEVGESTSGEGVVTKSYAHRWAKRELDGAGAAVEVLGIDLQPAFGPIGWWSSDANPDRQWQPFSFAEYLRSEIGFYESGEHRFLSMLGGAALDDFPQQLVYAFAASQLELVPEALRLCEIAEDGASLSKHLEAGLSHEAAFLVQFEDEFAKHHLWRAFLLSDLSKPSWQKIRDHFARVFESFPASTYAARASNVVDTLDRMAADEDSRPLLSDEEIALLPVDDQAPEWIRRLREQDGAQFSQPGACQIIIPWEDLKVPTPAHRLITLGFDAVPALIEGLGDDSLTRSVGYHRNFYFSHHNLRVGDCCHHILLEIAGQRFEGASWLSFVKIDEGEREAAVSASRHAIGLWWEEAQERGELALLIDGVSAGGSNARMQVRALIERYPGNALGAIREGLSQEPRSYIRSALLWALGELAGGEGDVATGAVEALREEVMGEGVLAPRLYAFKTLKNGAWADDENAMREALLALWNVRDERKDASAYGHSHDVKAALFWEAIQAEDGELRRMVIEDWADGETAKLKIDFLWNLWEEHDEHGLSKETLGHLEGWLVSSLDDDGIWSGLSASAGSIRYSDPRVCDVAHYALASLWPERYSASMSGTEDERDADIETSKAIWAER